MRFTLITILLLLLAPQLGAEERELITWKTITCNTEFHSEGADAGDFNKDGKMDVVSGPFWYEGPEFQKQHRYAEGEPFNPLGYSKNFFAFSYDFNQDGWSDILIYGFPGEDASWYANPQGKEGLWTRHKVLDVVDNESPLWADITGDGKPDIICSQGGFFGYAEINSDPTQPWKFTPISDQSAGGKFTHGLGVGDVNQDGRMDILEKNGWWEQPEKKTGGVWEKHAFQFSGPGGAQMYAYDFDGDGDNDVLTSLAAHGYGLAWYEQITENGEPTFKIHQILGNTADQNEYGVVFSQLHAIDLADIDGDGLKDIITGKRYWAHGPKGDAEPNAAPVLYWLQTMRSDNGVRFVPHQIYDNSGVGTEIQARDVNGDKLLDVVVGNKKGTFVHIQERKKVSEEEWKKAQPIPRTQAAAPSRQGLPEFSGLQPQEAAKAMTVPPGFRVTLAAGEPQVHQPVAFAIDERGRIWVAEAYTYPTRAPEGQGRDKIVILEDKDGDGSFETRKIFTEGLNLVSGLQVGFGGVWVGAAPYFMFIPDKNRDDVPDAEPQILLDGWGYHDTHETLNAFIWGPDGWLYGCHGVFTHSNVGKPGTPDDQRVPLNCGVWRYHPTRHQFEVFAHGSSNPWGFDFNEHGQAFISACVIPHLYHVIQGARYQRQGGQHFNVHTYDDIKTIADHAHFAGNIRDHAWWGRDDPIVPSDTDAAGGGHAHCGGMIYLGDNWPDQYRNTFFMCNIHGNRVNNDIMKREGSGFVGTHGQDFLFANDQWFRGINLQYGPDGGVYLIDWYDKNACHRVNPEIWDRTNGRIYKITWGTPNTPDIDLGRASIDGLLHYLTHKNQWFVRTARRVLQERAATDEKLAATVGNSLLKMILTESLPVEQRLIGLWTLHSIGGLDPFTSAQLLASDQEYLRAWTIQLVCEQPEAVTPEMLGHFVSLSRRDESPVVRLYLASALQRLPLSARWPIAEGLLKHAVDVSDRNLPLMYWYGIEPLVVENPQRALELASASQIPLVSSFIYRRAAVDEKGIGPLMLSLGKTDDVNRQKIILTEVVNVLQKRGQMPMPEGWPAVYQKLAASRDAEIRNQAQFVTVKFGDKSLFPSLRKIATNAEAAMDARQQAISALISGKDEELPALLHGLLDEQPMRSIALKALAQFAHPKTPEAIINRYQTYNETQRTEAIAALTSRADYALALLNAVEAKKVPQTDLSAYTVRELQRFENKEIAEKLTKVWGTIRTTSEEKQKALTEYKRQLPAGVLASANLPHGRELFNKTCAKCHILFGEGGKIGPEITGSNRANIDYLLENILDPNALVGRNYQATVVALVDGRVITGLIKEENENALVLQTPTDEVVVPKKEIDERNTSAISIMPEGQLDKMPPTDIRDLIAYLQSSSQVPLPGTGPYFDEKTNRVAGAIEGETLKVLSVSDGNAGAQKMGGFPKGQWSGVDHLWWTGGKPGAKLTVEFNVPAAGDYELFTVLTKARDYGIVRLYLNDQPLTKEIDLYNNPDVITTGVMSLGTHTLKAGPQRLTVEITGANPRAVKAYMFGIDYLYLAAKKETAATSTE